MISTTHITTGAALGLAVGSQIAYPAIAIPVALAVGVLSHHILDSIPHTDPGSFREEADKSFIQSHEIRFAIIDNLLGTLLVLMFFFTREPSWPMLFGAAGANFPDIFHHPPFWGPNTRALWGGWYFRFHQGFHTTARGDWILFGVLTNVLFIVLSLYYLVHYLP